MFSMNITPFNRHVVFKVNGDAVAVATVELNAPVGLFYVSAYDNIDFLQVSDAEKETLLEFGCIEELKQIEVRFQFNDSDGNTIQGATGYCWRISHLEPSPENDSPTIYKFCVSR